MSRAKPQKAQAHKGPRVESTQGPQATPRVPPGQKGRKTRLRHRPVTNATTPLLAACRARYDALGLSLRQVVKDTELDKSDVSKALNLREEPTARTLGTLCEYFDVATTADLKGKDRKRALLVSINSILNRLRELTGQFIEAIEEDI